MRERLYFLLLDGGGKPAGNVIVILEAEFEEPNLQSRRTVLLQTLQTNERGFAGFDTAGLDTPERPARELFLSIPTSGERISLLGKLDRGDSPEVLAVVLSQGALPSPPGLLPEVSVPLPSDSKAFPSGFGSKPRRRLGSGGCEELLRSYLAERVFLFSELAFAETGPSRLGSVAAGDCDALGTNVIDPLFPDGPPCARPGVLHEFRTLWIPLGHSLGELVYSVALAPCEQVNLAVVDWQRTDSALRQEELRVREELTHSLRRDRVIEETMNAVVKERQGGASGFLGGVVSGIFGGDGKQSEAGSISKKAAESQGNVFGAFALGASLATTHGKRTVEAEDLQRLSDSVQQAGSATRSLFGTVITQVSQKESAIAQTRTVRNHNHCHALTVLYYEVLRHYRTVVSVSDQDLLFVKFPVLATDSPALKDWALKYRYIIEPLLLEPSLADGFDDLSLAAGATPDEDEEEDRIAGLAVLVEIGREGRDNAGRQIRLRLQSTRPGLDFVLDWNLKPEFATPVRDADDLFRRGQTNHFYVDLMGGTPEADADDVLLFGAPLNRGENPPVLLSDIHRVAIFSAADWWMDRLIVEYISERGGRQVLYDSTREPADLAPPVRIEQNSTYYSSPLAELHPAGQGGRPNLGPPLLQHIGGNRYFYFRWVWLLQDPGERAASLSHYTYDGRRLLNVIQSQPVGVLGDYVAFPMIEGQANQTPAPAPVMGLTAVPTRGVFGEAKLGECNCCEERDVTRFWDWQESPCPDTAPDLAPAGTESRFQPPDTTPSPVPASTINIQNAPVAPDPTGLGAALEVLRTSDIFRDMSGRAELTQILGQLAATVRDLQQNRGREGTGTGPGLGGSSDSLSPLGSGSTGGLGRPPVLSPQEAADGVQWVDHYRDLLGEDAAPLAKGIINRVAQIPADLLTTLGDLGEAALDNETISAVLDQLNLLGAAQGAVRLERNFVEPFRDTLVGELGAAARSLDTESLASQMQTQAFANGFRGGLVVGALVHAIEILHQGATTYQLGRYSTFTDPAWAPTIIGWLIVNRDAVATVPNSFRSMADGIQTLRSAFETPELLESMARMAAVVVANNVRDRLAAFNATSPTRKGYALGEVTGAAATEVAALFVGPEELIIRGLSRAESAGVRNVLGKIDEISPLFYRFIDAPDISGVARELSREWVSTGGLLSKLGTGFAGTNEAELARKLEIIGRALSRRGGHPPNYSGLIGTLGELDTLLGLHRNPSVVAVDLLRPGGAPTADFVITFADRTGPSRFARGGARNRMLLEVQTVGVGEPGTLLDRVINAGEGKLVGDQLRISPEMARVYETPREGILMLNLAEEVDPNRQLAFVMELRSRWLSRSGQRLSGDGSVRAVQVSFRRRAFMFRRGPTGSFETGEFSVLEFGFAGTDPTLSGVGSESWVESIFGGATP